MKYIRTKDGIYIPCEIKGYENYCWCLKGNLNVSKLEDLIVIAQADTIEELCDEFVCEHYISANTNDLIKLKPNGLIYGAIWTDKGLIYVAKMNDKGELELL